MGGVVSVDGVEDPITQGLLREWCQRLADPSVCLWVKDRRTSTEVIVRGTGEYCSPEADLADAMLAAGLISYGQRELAGVEEVERVEYVASLTAEGLALARAHPEHGSSSGSADEEFVDLFASSSCSLLVSS